MWRLQWKNYINLILIFILQTKDDFGRWKQHLFDILFYTQINFFNCYRSIQLASSNFYAQDECNRV